MANDTPTVVDAAAAGEPSGIDLHGLRKEFGDIVAVEGIDLSVEPGEFLVLLGPSGCGKTTTLRMIAGLEVPDAGHIEIDDEDVTGLHPRHRDLSMVFQSYALYPHKNVRENLAFPLKKMDLDAAARTERIERVAELLEIDEHLDKQPKQLSGGQRQRVAVGRTIVREPSVFLMDEPLSNLDAKLRVKARSEIRDLQQQLRTTTVYVTHDQEEAMSVADRIAVVRDGQIEQIGTPEAVYRNPVNEFVAGFIGEPEMNFLPVTPTDDGLAIDGVGAPSVLPLDAPAAARTLGVRPEDVEVVATGDTPAGVRAFECGLELLEPQGHADELTLSRDGHTLTAWLRERADDLERGDSVDVAFDPDELHLFDDHGEVIA